MNVVTQHLRSLRVQIRSGHCRAALALALADVVTPASAQIAGGGGNAGLLSQIINWVATNIIGGLIAAGVLFRHRLTRWQTRNWRNMNLLSAARDLRSCRTLVYLGLTSLSSLWPASKPSCSECSSSSPLGSSS